MTLKRSKELEGMLSNEDTHHNLPVKQVMLLSTWITVARVVCCIDIINQGSICRARRRRTCARMNVGKVIQRVQSSRPTAYALTQCLPYYWHSIQFH